MATEPQAPPVNAPLYVRRVSVKRLFGQYSYDLQLGPNASEGHSKLIVLYGDNGSGKTTVLKLIFHLLAHGAKFGHRGFIGKTPFESFTVELGTEFTVSARRTADKLIGDFRMEIRRGSDLVAAATFHADENGKLKYKHEGPPESPTIFDALAGFNFGLYLLSDNRQITTNQYDAQEEETEDSILDAAGNLKATVAKWMAATGRHIHPPSHDATPLEIALRRVNEWATQQVLKGSNKGEQDVNAVYTDVLSRIADTGRHADHSGSGLDKDALIRELEKEAQRSVAFSQYDLIAPIDVEKLTEPIRRATEDAYPMLVNVITPYVDSLKARLNALQQVHDAIDSFCEIINSFYKNKKLTFSLQNGPIVTTPQGGTLQTSLLSSGERQLLLLFCNILVAKDQNSIFIIDEPELSLNVKWQRNLVRTLLEFTKGSHVQFLLATHSIELLARHKDHVAKLEERELVGADR
jgi:energy-coupling factor transporter ATP-binding protein EcfA2